MIWVQPKPWSRCCVLDKTLYDDYLCWWLQLNKQQIQRTRIRRNSQEQWITENSLAGADSSKHEVVIAMKSARIVQYLASDAIRWQEDKYAQQKKSQKNFKAEINWQE